MKRRAHQKVDFTRISVDVNGEAWVQVPDLGQSGSRDSQYVPRSEAVQS